MNFLLKNYVSIYVTLRIDFENEVDWDAGSEPDFEETVRTKDIDIHPKSTITKVPGSDVRIDFP
ncbi:MAG: hypothetical protein ACJAYA_000515 [Bacteroidia bacterium]|jgi:hypothetical protein